MPRIHLFALAAVALSACSGAVVSPTSAVGVPLPPEAPTVVATQPTAPDTTLYPSTDGDRDAVLIREVVRLGVMPIGASEADVLALFGPPDTDDLDSDFPGGEMHVEIYNTMHGRAATTCTCASPGGSFPTAGSARSGSTTPPAAGPSPTASSGRAAG